MSPISHALKLYSAANVVEPELVVDIDTLIYFGNIRADELPKSPPSRLLPRFSNIRLISLPFDFDYLVTLGKCIACHPHTVITPTPHPTSNENTIFDLLPHMLIESLSSQDTNTAEANNKPNNSLESSLYSIVAYTNKQIMDIDHLIQIGQNIGLTTLSHHTLSMVQSLNQSEFILESRKTPRIVNMGTVTPLDLPSCYDPTLNSQNQFPTKRASALPLDIDNLIQIGTFTAHSREIHCLKFASCLEHNSSTLVSALRMKHRFWRKYVDKLRKLFLHRS